MDNQTDRLGDAQAIGKDMHEKAAQLTESAKDTLGEAVEPVKEKAIESAEHQKDAGAEQMRVFAKAVHGAAGQLESEMPQFARQVHDAGAYLERAASELSESSMTELWAKLQNATRRQPATVFSGAVLAGFALSRFLKSSASHAHADGQGQARSK